MTQRTNKLRRAMVDIVAIATSTIAFAGHYSLHDETSIEQEEIANPELVAAGLKASTRILGMSYLANRSLIEMTDLAGGGIRIHTPKE